MVHNAYDSFLLLKSCPARIECAASYGPKLFLGCIDGSMRICAPESSASTSEKSSPFDRERTSIMREPYVVENTMVGFWKKPLVAMEVSASRELLISLSESIAIHRVPNLEAVAFIGKAKGANVYAWDDRRGYLCFGRQKRIGIFRYDGGREFSELKDFAVPDVVKSMAWCGENICLGIRKEYIILNSTNGALSDVFSSGRIAPPLVVPLPSGELLLGKVNLNLSSVLNFLFDYLMQTVPK
ncbi:vacuolar sorting protein 39-like [Telopea speciosissima]|uniref:vacuolar sorting protein 39-like n=1 Tax=Telopea speciosissima TaxID=54955 RepID=UPI001CC775FF|nr:vacuolar sorting protein 39-like [Telopea speciosissima]